MISKLIETQKTMNKLGDDMRKKLVDVKYYKKDCAVGFRDGAYFESEHDSKDSETGKEYTAYWLVDCEGNRAPESIYVELMKGVTQ